MNKRIILTLALSTVFGLALADAEIYPTYPGTNLRDYSKPGYTVREDPHGTGRTVYPSYPGTSMRDYSKPGYGPSWRGLFTWVATGCMDMCAEG